MGDWVTEQELRNAIISALTAQGYEIEGDKIRLRPGLSKEDLRALHAEAVNYRINKARKGLERKEPRLIERFANGHEVDPKRIRPRLVEVQPDSEDELLFRYASLHWSIPVSSGYGRRLRFLVIDEHNDKLIGIFGLGDPVFALGPRDRWVGWDSHTRAERLCYVMDAFVLGAVPPYSSLLCGKLVAMLVTSNEVRQAYARKYGKRVSLIRNRAVEGDLALITTTSALGRSSLYNRISYDGRRLFISVGYSQGSGEFHFANGLYDAMMQYVRQHSKPTAKNERWGSGFRNRREIVKKCLMGLGLSADWLYHGVRREIFVVPLGANAREYLRGEEPELQQYDQPADALFEAFRERWLLPRAERDKRYLQFDRNTYRLWG